jgi:FYVE zinc finger
MDFAQGKEGSLRRYSTFIGQSDLDLNIRGDAAAVARSVMHCKLCIRPFNSIFRRKQRCKWCSDIICQDCCAQKAKLPGKGNRVQQVCDACFGALVGMVGEDVRLLTIKEESGLQAAGTGGGAGVGKEKTAAERERERREERRRTT